MGKDLNGIITSWNEAAERVREEGDEQVRFDALWPVMEDRTQTQIPLESAEGLFDPA